MTRLIYSNEKSHQADPSTEAAPSSESSQVLHLKRLMVTLKQHYEKSLHSLNIELQVEQNQRAALQKEFDELQLRFFDTQKLHEEELHALRNQQSCLKERLKAAQEELKELLEHSLPDSEGAGPHAQRKEILDKSAAYMIQAEKAQLEADQLRRKLQEAQQKIEVLQKESIEHKERTDQEIARLQMLAGQQKEEVAFETVVSKTSSHHLRQEMEGIKKTLAEETKALENRYVEILNEKVALENQCRQYADQLSEQSSHLDAFQEKIGLLEMHREELEKSLESKDSALVQSSQDIERMQGLLADLEGKAKEKDFVQDKYEQLKDEWNQLGERLEEAIEARSQLEGHIVQLQQSTGKQELQITELNQQLQDLQEERKILEEERDQLKMLLEESETRLKVAQQHLAKKVKEAALLAERVEEQQGSLSGMSQSLEQQKTQIVQLQASVDLYQRQEKRLQEQLHDALKGTESQVAKWEEKYFKMYDKWQESENKIRELKKFEEKHLQMQHLLANLGNFMGSSFNPAAAAIPSHSGEARLPEDLEESAPEDQPSSEIEHERVDLFGMRQSQDKLQQHPFT